MYVYILDDIIHILRNGDVMLQYPSVDDIMASSGVLSSSSSQFMSRETEVKKRLLPVTIHHLLPSSFISLPRFPSLLPHSSSFLLPTCSYSFPSISLLPVSLLLSISTFLPLPISFLLRLLLSLLLFASL